MQIHPGALTGKSDLLYMNGCDGLLTDCRVGVPCEAIVASSIAKPLRVKGERCVPELHRHFVPMGTLFAAEHEIRWPFSSTHPVPRSRLGVLSSSSVHLARDFPHAAQNNVGWFLGLKMNKVGEKGCQCTVLYLLYKLVSLV